MPKGSDGSHNTDNYAAEASLDPKWVEVSDAGEAAFRNLDAGAKA